MAFFGLCRVVTGSSKQCGIDYGKGRRGQGRGNVVPGHDGWGGCARGLAGLAEYGRRRSLLLGTAPLLFIHLLHHLLCLPHACLHAHQLSQSAARATGSKQGREGRSSGYNPTLSLGQLNLSDARLCSIVLTSVVGSTSTPTEQVELKQNCFPVCY